MEAGDWGLEIFACAASGRWMATTFQSLHWLCNENCLIPYYSLSLSQHHPKGLQQIFARGAGKLDVEPENFALGVK